MYKIKFLYAKKKKKKKMFQGYLGLKLKKGSF